MKRRLTAILLALCMELPCMMSATVIAAETEAIETENIGAESESATEGNVEEAVQTETVTESEETASGKVEEAEQTETAGESEETFEENVEDAAQPESGTEEENTTDTENAIVDEEAKESETTSLKEQGKVSRSPAKMVSRVVVNQCTVTYKDGVNGTAFPDQICRVTVIINPVTNKVIANDPTPEFKGTPTRTGYRFTGWDPAESGFITEDVVYTATWIPNTYTVYMIDGDDGETTAAQNFTYDQEQALPKNIKSKSGYVFGGWNTKRDGSGTNYSEGEVVKNLTDQDQGMIWLWIQWKEDRNGNGIADDEEQCTVRYITNPNDLADPSNQTTENLLAGDPTPAYKDGSTPTRTGYHFEDWEPAVADTVTGGATYTAKWKANTYRVVFFPNMGGLGEVGDYQDFIYDKEQSLKEVGYFRAGYVLAGWNTKSDGSGTGYSVGQVVKNLTESSSILLYAQWKEDRNGNGIADDEEQRYTVRYINPDDPSGFSDQITGNLLAGDKTPAFEGDTPSRTGYEFAGWEPDVADTVTGDATYTAKWTAKSYKVTLVLNGGTLADEKNVTSYTYAEGAVLPTADNVTFLCHTFDGWYADSSFAGSPEAEISKSSTGDRVFYAKWTESHTPAKAVKENEKVETCEANGSYDNVIYCAICSAELSRNTVTVPATGHALVYHEAKAASCTETGYEAYWKCKTCGKIFSDEAGTVEISNPIEIKATGHDLKAIKKKDASCTEAGYEAYWKCKTCGSLFSDEAGKTEISNPIEIKATGHNLEKVEKKDASCTEDGYEAYWKCNTCGSLFSDEIGTVEISNPVEIKATGHDLEKVEKKDATAEKEGNSTYWFCAKCNKYFSDEKAETEIKKEDTVLAKLTTVSKKTPEKTTNTTKATSTTDKTTNSSPKTGDSTDVQLYVILMLISIGAAAGVGAKRKLKTRR